MTEPEAQAEVEAEPTETGRIIVPGGFKGGSAQEAPKTMEQVAAETQHCHRDKMMIGGQSEVGMPLLSPIGFPCTGERCMMWNPDSGRCREVEAQEAQVEVAHLQAELLKAQLGAKEESSGE
jgi:hypothetical protein